MGRRCIPAPGFCEPVDGEPFAARRCGLCVAAAAVLQMVAGALLVADFRGSIPPPKTQPPTTVVSSIVPPFQEQEIRQPESPKPPPINNSPEDEQPPPGRESRLRGEVTFRWEPDPGCRLLTGFPAPSVNCYLLGFTVFGVIIMVSFGFGQVPSTSALHPNSSADGWMKGSVIWTMAMLWNYYTALPTGSAVIQRTLLFTSILLFAGALILLLGARLGNGLGFDGPVWHVRLAIMTGVVMCVMDWIILYHHRGKRRAAARMNLLFADLPSVAAFLVLALYLQSTPDNSEVFISGTIAFQMFSAKVIFVAVEVYAEALYPNE